MNGVVPLRSQVSAGWEGSTQGAMAAGEGVPSKQFTKDSGHVLIHTRCHIVTMQVCVQGAPIRSQSAQMKMNLFFLPFFFFPSCAGATFPLIIF